MTFSEQVQSEALKNTITLIGLLSLGILAGLILTPCTQRIARLWKRRPRFSSGSGTFGVPRGTRDVSIIMMHAGGGGAGKVVRDDFGMAMESHARLKAESDARAKILYDRLVKGRNEIEAEIARLEKEYGLKDKKP